MCGIAGWIDLKNDISNNEKILQDMTFKIAHRGPDATGFWMSSHALIGHKRLNIIDPSGGSQPMVRSYRENTYVLTYNGELYNTQDLRNKLTILGHEFTSYSDTEVLLVSYIEWGPKCVEYFNGIFGFAIWDEKNQSLFLGRDRFGVKPLFYTIQDSSLIFGSEIKSILCHPSVKPILDKEGLSEIFVLSPSRTPGSGVFKDIFELKPAHCLLFNIDGVNIRKYWSLRSQEHTDDINVTVDIVRSLVKDSILRQLVSDVPVCTFLSGGLDSSTISYYASSDFINNNKGTLNTYSIDYIDNDKYFSPSAFQPNADSYWVNRVSNYLNTNHNYLKFDTNQLVDSLKDALYARDLPGMADIDSSLWLFCKEVKKGATVALSGECADEIFGGYPWFHNENLMNTNTFPWMNSIDQKLKVLSPDLISMINPHKYLSLRYNETLQNTPRLEGENSIESRRREIFYLNIVWFMSTLLDRKDRMSMAHGLEVRVPFCDHRLVQYVWNIPWDMKMHGGREKGILRKALDGILPNDVIERKKSPFPKTHNPSYEECVKTWLLDILNTGSSPILSFVDSSVIKNLISNKSDYGKPWFGQLMATPQLFAFLIQVDCWMRDYGVIIKP